MDGDSKTDNTSSYGEWDYIIKYLTEQQTSQNWSYYNVADAGDTLADGLAALTASLASLDASPEPQYALINFGANDVQSLPAEATWKQNLRDYVEEIHIKWSTTQIYVALPWREGYDSESDTLATWITAVADEYTYVSVGMDERIWFKTDDTLWFDGLGVHYNDKGNRECALQWRSLL